MVLKKVIGVPPRDWNKASCGDNVSLCLTLLSFSAHIFPSRTSYVSVIMRHMMFMNMECRATLPGTKGWFYHLTSMWISTFYLFFFFHYKKVTVEQSDGFSWGIEKKWCNAVKVFKIIIIVLRGGSGDGFPKIQIRLRLLLHTVPTEPLCQQHDSVIFGQFIEA